MQFHGYRRRIHRIVPVVESFYGMADIPTVFQERIDKTLELITHGWMTYQS